MSIKAIWMSSLCVAVSVCLLTGCQKSLNDPWPDQQAQDNTLYLPFKLQPKDLDPATNNTKDGNEFIAQIYESPLQYHLFKRPYELIPQALSELPEQRFYDDQGKELDPTDPDSKIARTDYVLRFRTDLRYQPHPALAKDANGAYRYHHLTSSDLEPIQSLKDFSESGSRPAVAADFAYQIKRIAAPWVNATGAGMIGKHIVGFKEYTEARKADANKPQVERDKILRETSISGIRVVDDHTLVISVKGKYPRFLNLLAMPFVTAMPWEADVFYHQPGMAERNLILRWYPIGTGPYMLTENNPAMRMVLTRNPNFHEERFPSVADIPNANPALSADAGKRLPFIDKVIYSREQEVIPQWSKFLQGYYDYAALAPDMFDQVIQIDPAGKPQLTQEMVARDIKLDLKSGIDFYFYGFNLQDPLVGGTSERSRLLRRAISIAIDQEAANSVLYNGQAISAMGPIPPGLFGFENNEAGINPYVYEWKNGQAKRRTVEEARKLLTQAGYPEGKDPRTGKPLKIRFLFTSNSAQAKNQVSWLAQQLAKLGIELQFDSVDWNRFQDAIQNGSAQFFSYGWGADYPDPENFLFLFTSAESKTKFNGQNATNYSNPEYDQLYAKMINLEDGPERLAIIRKMVEILRRDAPMVWGFHTRSIALSQQWLSSLYVDSVIRNVMKYRKIDPQKRMEMRHLWNKPVWWPVWMLLGWLALILVPGIFIIRQRNRKRALS